MREDPFFLAAEHFLFVVARDCCAPTTSTHCCGSSVCLWALSLLVSKCEKAFLQQRSTLVWLVMLQLMVSKCEKAVLLQLSATLRTSRARGAVGRPMVETCAVHSLLAFTVSQH